MGTSLFPHQNLDWHTSRLETAVEEDPGSVEPRVQLAQAYLSRALYHGSGEPDCMAALGVARKLLGEDPASNDGLVVAGLALVGMDRPDAALKYLRRAEELDPNQPALRLALGRVEAQQDLGGSVRQLEAACRLAPEAWETHLELGRALSALSHERQESRRLVERTQYHLVQALQLGVSAEQLPGLLCDMGVACLQTGHFREAEKFFLRLRESDEHASTARYYLGKVAYSLGKYHNAVQHFRQYLRDCPDDPIVLARTAMSWFQLGEYGRARTACNQALLIDPLNVLAQYALGCTLAKEGEQEEALKVFRGSLKDHPEHMPTYVELVRGRQQQGDVNWLVRALEVEVGQYDRLPFTKDGTARRVTRERIRVVLEELRLVGPSMVQPVLASIDRTQDECLRFELWEAASAMTVGAVADGAAALLRESGANYSVELGLGTLAVAGSLPEPVLTAGLGIEESDLKRAAVSRHGPANDVNAHRNNTETERRTARAFQALVLLAIAVRRSGSGKKLLRTWVSAADPDLATAAWTALALYGEPQAAQRLQERAGSHNAVAVLDQLLGLVSPKTAAMEPRTVSEADHATCTTCGRKEPDAAHLMAGGGVILCDHCIMRIGQNRHTLAAPDEATCDLCARTPFEARDLYALDGISVCAACLELSLGVLEREEVDRFLSAW